MESLRRVRVWLERVLESVVIAILLSLTVVVIVAVAFRKGGASLAWYDEIASIQLAWLTYYGAALAALKRAHIGFSGLVKAMRPGLRVPTVILSESIVIAFFAVLTWTGVEVHYALEGDYLVSLPEVPVQLTKSVIPIGGALFIIAELLLLPEVVRDAWRGAPPLPEAPAVDPPQP